ncbi:MAG: 4Fe-4S dicluster domain-containing protein [Thermoanaerobaculaceae bacterium]
MLKVWKGGRAVGEETAKKAKGTIILNKEICKGCSFCIDFCPTHCLEFSQEFNRKGYHFPVLARPEDCTGCDLCGLYCPDYAIFGVKFKDLERTVSAA